MVGKLMNSAWLQGFVYLVAAVLVSAFLPSQKLRTQLSAVEWTPIVTTLAFVFWPIAGLLALRFALRTWRNWRLVSTAGDPWYHGFDPALRLVSRWRRNRFGRDGINRGIESCLAGVPAGSQLYSLSAIDSAGIRRESTVDPRRSPIVALKLPARSHLAAADFAVLRLLRHLIARGGLAIVIIVDAVRYEEESQRDMRAASKRTRHFVRRVLGASPEVVTLTEMSEESPSTATRFMLKYYVPFFVRAVRRTSKEVDDPTLVSLFSKGMIVEFLSRRARARPVIVMQWERRLHSWREILALLPEWNCDLVVSSFLAIRDFPSESGQALGSRSQDVAIAPRGSWMRELSSGRYRLTYVLIVSRLLLGERRNGRFKSFFRYLSWQPRAGQPRGCVQNFHSVWAANVNRRLASVERQLFRGLRERVVSESDGAR